MRLTLLRAKEALARKSPADQLEFRINRVCERYLLHGKFAGSLQRLAIYAPYGQVTLPRGYRTMEGVKIDGVVLEMANQWYELIPGQSDSFGYSLNAVRDLGDGWAVMRTPPIDSMDLTIPQQDFPEGGTISVSYPGSETLATTIEGRDQDGVPITLEFTGEQTLASPFSRISRIHKEIGDVPVTIRYTGEDAAITTIAIMEPTEEETYYRRYILDNFRLIEQVAAIALCKRRHIEFTSDSDILPFSNISALALGMDALQQEDEGEYARSDQLWAQGVDLLNKELQDTDGDNMFPAIRFLYPGRTQPNLTSFY